MAVIAVAIGVLTFSPVLATREVQVVGNQLVSTDQVIAEAQVPLEVPLPRLPRSAIRDRVGALAPVAEVKLGVSLPHALVITVTERTMVYQVAAAGQFHWIDASGVDFHTATEQAPGVVGVVDLDNEQARADLAVVIGALSAETIEQTTTITWHTQDSIVLALADGRQINWGSATQSEEKAALLPTLLGMEASWIDVSVPSHPAIR